MTEPELSVIPVEARPFQGAAAGVATRLVASAIDAFVVMLTLVGAYAAYVMVRFFLSPRTFQMPEVNPFWSVSAFLGVVLVYLTASWWISGRTLGDQVMGVRVISEPGGRLRLPRSFIRAVFCAVFPVGLLWCAVNPRRRSVQDLVLRTSVVYDWLPRAVNLQPRREASTPERRRG